MKLWHWIAIIAVVAIVAFYVGKNKTKKDGCGCEEKTDVKTDVKDGKKGLAKVKEVVNNLAD
jgi:hypothetical protein